MKSVDLNAINSPQQTKAPKVGPIRPGTSDPVKHPIAPQGWDQISVSGTAMQLGRMVQQAKAPDGVRQQRVESLRELVNAGQYHVSASDIADAILRGEEV